MRTLCGRNIRLKRRSFSIKLSEGRARSRRAKRLGMGFVSFSMAISKYHLGQSEVASADSADTIPDQVIDV